MCKCIMGELDPSGLSGGLNQFYKATQSANEEVQGGEFQCWWKMLNRQNRTPLYGEKLKRGT